MSYENKIRQLVSQWPSRKDFAHDANASIDQVHKWVSTGSIPARYWRSIIRAAKLRQISLSADALTDWHALEARHA